MSNYRKVKGENRIILASEANYDAFYQKLPPSIYRLGNAGSMFSGVIPMFDTVPEGDKLVRFTSGVVGKVLEQTDNFLSEESKSVYKELKLTHKMGMLFYGKPGTGKTSVCMLVMKNLIEKYEAVCFDCTGKTLPFVLYCVKKVREIQDNPIVLFMDEFEESIIHDEASYLTFLDGTSSVDNLIFICCTNYIDKIPDRIKKRKSRIKHLHGVNSLPEGVYREYLVDRVPTMAPSEISKFAYLAVDKGLTIDQLKHALIDHKLEHVAIEEAVDLAAKFEIEKTED